MISGRSGWLFEGSSGSSFHCGVQCNPFDPTGPLTVQAVLADKQKDTATIIHAGRELSGYLM